MAKSLEDIIDEISLAFNKATILGVEFQRKREVVAISLAPS
jgi:hypothetical protein